MAYELHIEKKRGAIRLEDWKSAVAEFDNMRLCSGEHSITNPESGDVISLPRRDADGEVYFADDKTWRPMA